MTDREWSGVWLSNEPFDQVERSEALLEVRLDLTENDLADFEWIEEGKGYREWLVPAIINPTITEIQLLDYWEEKLVRRSE
jgi:hypothetical protein